MTCFDIIYLIFDYFISETTEENNLWIQELKNEMKKRNVNGHIG